MKIDERPFVKEESLALHGFSSPRMAARKGLYMKQNGFADPHREGCKVKDDERQQKVLQGGFF
eukprot:1930923-Amphidinium_carterae.1